MSQLRTGSYENGTVYQHQDYYDRAEWNETHFSKEIIEKTPRLRLMNWIPSSLNLSGSPFAEQEYNSVVIIFLYEYQNSCPLSFEDYIDNIQYASLHLIISNEYFDPSDIENPISTAIKDNYNTYFSPKIFTRYMLSIQKNSYEIETGDLFSQK